MTNDTRVFQLFETLSDRPLLPENSWSSNAWDRIDDFKCVTNRHEHVLFYTISQDFYDADYAAYSAVEQSYRHHFAQIIHTVASAWGSPQRLINDLPSEASDDEQRLENDLYLRGGLALAYWCRTDRVLYVEVEHQKKEFPLFLLLGTRTVQVNTSACNE